MLSQEPKLSNYEILRDKINSWRVIRLYINTLFEISKRYYVNLPQQCTIT